MIEQPTVFVLGAGASAAFGFPLGRRLRQEIAESVGVPSPVNNALHHYYGYVWGHGGWERVQDGSKSLQDLEREAQEFWEALASPLYSIDAFLERRPEFEEIGKVAIAAILIPHEDPKQLPIPWPQLRWIDELFQKMDCAPDKLSQNHVKFITFNYDRSLEYYFLKALRTTYGMSEQDAATSVEAIPIVHIHGQLGQPHFQSPDGRGYTPEVTLEALKRAVEGMRIVYQQLDDAPEIQSAHEYIEEAQILCFLGFGYHPDSIRRLAVNEHFAGEALLGTCFGLEKNERRIATGYFARKRDYGSGEGRGGHEFKIVMGDADEDAYTFLRRYPIF